MSTVADASDRVAAVRGEPLRREGAAKLTGAAPFTDDLVVPGAWYGSTVRATEPLPAVLGPLASTERPASGSRST